MGVMSLLLLLLSSWTRSSGKTARRYCRLTWWGRRAGWRCPGAALPQPLRSGPRAQQQGREG